MFTGQPRRGFTSTNGDEPSLDELYKNAPELAKRKRRAKALRSGRDRLQAMEDTETPLGGVSQTSDGGLYETVGRYIPNYGGLAQKAVGALGGMYSDKKGDVEKAEDEYESMLGEETIRKYDVLGRRAAARRKKGYGY